MNRSLLHGIIALMITLGLSLVIVFQINGFLGLSMQDKELPDITLPADNANPTQTAPIGSGQALPLRIADFGSVGVIPDAGNWGSDYSHNLRHLEKAILPDPPYIDEAYFDQAETEFRAYVDLLAANGINGLIVPFLLEFINFDRVGSGYAVYGKNDNFRLRHLELKKRFKPLFAYARQKGVDIFLYSDMVMLTPSLESYLLDEIGGLDTTRPEFWQVYQKGLEELFMAFPEVKGIYIRIGEAGTIYNIKGWDYRSELLVRTGPAVKSMLNAFLDVAEQFDKLVVFRTWSVGVGQIGDMHTNPQTYETILGDIVSDRLIVSTKYCNGDFYSYIPLNRTLYQGSHKRLVEFQARREFEGFNAFPLFLGPLYQKALLSFLEQNKNIEGIWLWTQYGGPLRAGPLSLYPFHGFNLITDLNVNTTAQLALNPGLDIRGQAENWIRNHFGEDPVMVATLGDVLLSSFEIMKKGLYISEFAKKEVKALGLLPPPMLWIFEWDIVTAGNSVLSYVHFISGERTQAMVDEGLEAAAGARMMKRNVLQIKDRIEKNHRDFDKLIAALDYEINLFEVLAAYRTYFLNYYAWIVSGDASAFEAWNASLPAFLDKEDVHTRTYGHNLDFPAFNFTEAKIGVHLAKNTVTSRNMAAILSIAAIVALLSGLILKPGSRWCTGIRTAAEALVMPFRQEAVQPSQAPSLLAPVSMFLMTIVLAPLCLTYFAAPITTTAIYGFSATYLVMLLLFLGRKNLPALISTLAPVMLLCLIYLLVSSIRGPGFPWYFFWTSEGFRMALVVSSVFLLLWSYVVLYASGRKWFKQTPGTMVSMIVIMEGVQLTLLGVVSHMATLEKSLTAVNDELAVLPGGLSRILGITTHLNIPTDIPVYLIGAGICLTGTGFLFRGMMRKTMFKKGSI